MFDWFTLHVAALVVTAAVFGGMLFFAALFAPMVFRTLPRESAAGLMRRLFPVYFAVMAAVSALPALLLLPGGTYGVEIAIMLAVAGAFVLGSRVFAPSLERSRGAGNESRSAWLHRISVLVHLAQFAAVSVVLVRLAQ